MTWPSSQLSDIWAYGLPDGTGTQRQLVDPAGEITLAASYTPWGDALSVSGEGNFTYGYFGGVMGTATGLLYVGNGQYYDPSTGRFLNRSLNPDSANPYVPVPPSGMLREGGEPTGALIAPLVLLDMVYSRKKRRGKLDTFIIFLVLVSAVGMTLSACDSTKPVEAKATKYAESPSPTIVVTQDGHEIGSTPTPSATPSLTPTATCTATLTPDLIYFGVDISRLSHTSSVNLFL